VTQASTNSYQIFGKMDGVSDDNNADAVILLDKYCKLRFEVYDRFHGEGRFLMKQNPDVR